MSPTIYSSWDFKAGLNFLSTSINGFARTKDMCIYPHTITLSSRSHHTHTHTHTHTLAPLLHFHTHSLPHSNESEIKPEIDHQNQICVWEKDAQEFSEGRGPEKFFLSKFFGTETEKSGPGPSSRIRAEQLTRKLAKSFYRGPAHLSQNTWWQKPTDQEDVRSVVAVAAAVAVVVDCEENFKS